MLVIISPYVAGSPVKSGQGRSVVFKQHPDPPVLTGFFVSANAPGGGDGSSGNPWTMSESLARGSSLQGQNLTSGIPDGTGSTLAGTIIWCSSGTYGTQGDRLTPSTKGTLTNPVILRARPGHQVKCDYTFNTTTNDAQHLWFWGLFQHSTDPDLTDQNSMGFDIREDGNKLIHTIVDHNVCNGIGFWPPASEVYGCIVTRNGRLDDVAKAHGVYIQNDTVNKRLINTVVAHNMGSDIHGFGSEASVLKNVRIENLINIGFDHVGLQATVWKAGDMSSLVVDGLYLYSSAESTLGSFGPDNGEVPGTASISNVYGQMSGITVARWKDVALTNWTIIEPRNIALTHTGSGVPARYIIDNRTFYKANADISDYIVHSDSVETNIPRTLAAWQTYSSKDASSIQISNVQGIPTASAIFILTSSFEPKGHVYGSRGFVIIFNWANSSSVDVDVSSILNPGDNYVVNHVFDMWGTSSFSGTYGGGTIPMTMSRITPAMPSFGWPTGTLPLTPGPSFSVYEVRTSNMI